MNIIIHIGNLFLIRHCSRSFGQLVELVWNESVELFLLFFVPGIYIHIGTEQELDKTDVKKIRYVYSGCGWRESISLRSSPLIATHMEGGNNKEKTNDSVWIYSSSSTGCMSLLVMQFAWTDWLFWLFCNCSNSESVWTKLDQTWAVFTLKVANVLEHF